MSMQNRLDLNCDRVTAESLLEAEGHNYGDLISHFADDGQGLVVVVAKGDHYDLVRRLVGSVLIN